MQYEGHSGDTPIIMPVSYMLCAERLSSVTLALGCDVCISAAGLHIAHAHNCARMCLKLFAGILNARAVPERDG